MTTGYPSETYTAKPARGASTRPGPRSIPVGLVWHRWVLWGLGGLAAALVLLTPVYLLVRAGGDLDAAWQAVARASTVWTALRTLALAAAVTLVSGLIATPVAWLTTRSDLPLRRLWAVLTPLPLVVPSYVGAYLLVSALGPRGLVQQWLEPWLGIERLPSIYGFPGALLVLSLLNYPYMLLSVRAALQRMDPALEEAAASLGHGPWRTFWRVTLPQLRPALAAGGLLVALYTLRDFGAVAIMRFDTFTRVLYVQYRSFNREGAAALALVLVGLTLALVLLEARLRGRAHQTRGRGATRPPVQVALGVWRWPALALVGGVTGLGLALPAGLLGYWLVRGWLAGEPLQALWGAMGHSALGAGLAAVATLALALPVAILVVRGHSRARRGLERLVFMAYALPGIVVALALVFFGANYAPWLYQTLAMLVGAYVILFLPQAVAAVRTSLGQVDRSVEESARSLGLGPLAVFRRVTLPLTWPGVAAALSLVFLTAMKELPATLLLAPYGFRTLATVVWGAVSEAYFAQAAAPALLIILMSSVPMAFLILREHEVVE